MKNSVHKKFELNGNSFSNEEELIAFSKTVSVSLYRFLSDWFSGEDCITVKTSGSTGKPKEIQLKKEYMINSALATGRYFNLEEKTTALCCLPIDFIAGKMMFVRAITLGWQLDLIEPNSEPLKESNQKYDFCAMVPLQLSNSLDRIHQVKKLIVGGGMVSPQLQSSLKALSTEVYATYGMTETITHIAVKKLNHHLSLQGSITKQSHYLTLPNVSISTDNRNCLVISAPKVSSEEIITNDVVEIISENEFLWKGRYDNVINSGGIKLYPEEIEKKLSPYLSTRFFVTGIPDDILGEKLVLIIEGKENMIISAEVKNLKNILSKFETPKDVFFIAGFVETETGKIQRKETFELISLK
ncbi:MAG: AMP-binding protein [Flavobacteriaceae bacterium]|nr:AMP-binding protein [Flavobacteriaceae bacterium]